MTRGVRKMPAPMIQPTTRREASKRESPRLKEGSDGLSVFVPTETFYHDVAVPKKQSRGIGWTPRESKGECLIPLRGEMNFFQRQVDRHPLRPAPDPWGPVAAYV